MWNTSQNRFNIGMEATSKHDSWSWDSQDRKNACSSSDQNWNIEGNGNETAPVIPESEVWVPNLEKKNPYLFDAIKIRV